MWVIATQGWQPGTLESLWEVASALLGGERIVALARPGLAAEIAVRAPTALVGAAELGGRRSGQQRSSGVTP